MDEKGLFSTLAARMGNFLDKLMLFFFFNKTRKKKNNYLFFFFYTNKFIFFVQ